MENGLENSELSQAEEDVQPVAPVEGVTEELSATPQADSTEDQELYFDDEEPDTKKSSMSQEQAYAAFRKEQDKRKKKNQQLEAKEEENQQLKKDLEELKKTVGAIQKGAPPTLESCGFDEELFQQKTRDYYSAPEASPREGGKQEQPANQANDEAQFYLYQKEQEIMKVMPSYVESKEKVRNHLGSYGEIENPDAAIDFISDISRAKGVDVAKVIVAIDKRPSIVDDLLKAGSNQILMADILEKAAEKVKTRSKKPIDSEPAPQISNRGPIDATSAKVEKLRTAWVADPSAQNYAAYKNAKSQLKGN